MSARHSKIKSLKAREILDSRGNPTVEVDLLTDKGIFTSSVPSGASVGKYEAVELRDEGERYRGKGVLTAVSNINKIIAPKLKGKDSADQKEIDDFLIGLDVTENKSRLGANAILAVSMVCCRAGASSEDISLYKHIRQISGIKSKAYNLPSASFNVINGGAHAGNDLDFQEFMIAPQTKTFSGSFQMAAEIYQELKIIIKRRYSAAAINLGDEGGFAPPVSLPEVALGLILKAAEKINYESKIKIIIDAAASQFFVGGRYKTRFGIFAAEDLSDYYLGLIKRYPIVAIEDPFAENDWDAWKIFQSESQKVNTGSLIIGDDLLATNAGRIKEAQGKNACNATIIKLNQIGTVTEAMEATELAKSFGWKIMVSHRSGETNDDFIADFAVGIEADYIKAGAPARGERVAKYNRLLKIEELCSGR